jgi:nucleotide-binding universal stress UspA family protein
MYKFKNILAGLNLNESDSDIIAYTGLIASTAKAEKVSFFHILDHVEIPEKILQKFPSVIPSLPEAVMEKIKEEIKKALPEKMKYKIEYDTGEGSRIEAFLNEIKKGGVDLLVIGKKRSHDYDNRRLAERLARKAPCSILTVPAGSRPGIKTVLVPIDFSIYSVQALEEAIECAGSLGIREIFCVNVYTVPVGYSSTGKTYEEFSMIMLENAKDEYEEFINRIDLKGIRVNPIFELNERTNRGIEEVIKRTGADLVVIGSKGRSPGAALFLGSVTEHLLSKIDVPILAVKNKDQGLKFLDAILYAG